MEMTTKLKVRKLTPEMIREKLAAFEHRYAMTSADFWERYCAGELAEAADFFHWGALCYMALRQPALRALVNRA